MKVQELTNRPYGISYKSKLNVKYKGLYQEQKTWAKLFFKSCEQMSLRWILLKREIMYKLFLMP